MFGQQYRYKNRIDEVEWAKNRTKSTVRAKVEHVFGLMKLKFGFVKLRYRGLKKNATVCGVRAGESVLGEEKTVASSADGYSLGPEARTPDASSIQIPSAATRWTALLLSPAPECGSVLPHHRHSGTTDIADCFASSKYRTHNA